MLGLISGQQETANSSALLFSAAFAASASFLRSGAPVKKLTHFAASAPGFGEAKLGCFLLPASSPTAPSPADPSPATPAFRFFPLFTAAFLNSPERALSLACLALAYDVSFFLKERRSAAVPKCTPFAANRHTLHPQSKFVGRHRHLESRRHQAHSPL